MSGRHRQPRRPLRPRAGQPGGSRWVTTSVADRPDGGAGRLIEALTARRPHTGADRGCVRARPPGRDDRAVTVAASASRDGAPAWAWQHGQAPGSRPRCDVHATADGITAIMSGGRR